jgi:hypothetical protein
MVGTETPLPEKRSDPHGQCFRQSRDFRVIRSRQHLKLRLIVIVVGIDAIDDERVDAEVEPQRGVEALDKRHGTGLRLALGAEFACPLSQGSEYCLGEDAKEIRHQTRIVGQTVTEIVRKREHPLMNRNTREDTIHQVCRGIGHSPATTRITEAAAFTRVGNNAIQTAGIAMDTDETPRKHSTVYEGTEFALHE